MLANYIQTVEEHLESGSLEEVLPSEADGIQGLSKNTHITF